MDFQEHDSAMRTYYAARAPAMQYDLLSTADRRMLAEYAAYLREEISGRRVLEVACGTAYWTQRIANGAAHVLATDAVPEMIELARRRVFRGGNVELLLSDAYTLQGVRGGWSAGFHFQWFSHVPRSRVFSFLSRFHSRLAPGARVVFGDNLDEGTEADEEGNRYQCRKFPGAPDRRIIKNCPTERELEAVLRPWAAGIRHQRFERDWFVSYDLAG